MVTLAPNATMKKYSLLILFGLFICSQVFCETGQNFGVFKDWMATETQVLGMVKLTDTHAREYDSISAVDSNTVKVEEYNPAGTLISTAIVRFANKQISAIEYFNQWGLLYHTMHFKPETPHVYTVTDVKWGRNNYLPCKEAKFIYKNDLLAETQYISFAGKICNNMYGVADVKYTYFEDAGRYGTLKETIFFDDEGLPTTNKANDYHKVVYDRDKHGNQISVEWYNEQGHKLQNREGVFKIKSEYDADDNKTMSVYYGLFDDVKKNIYGVAKNVNTYHKGLKTATILYDENDNIVRASDTGSGIAMRLYEYNSNGFMTSEAAYNEMQRPVNDQSGIHKRIYKYNDRNMLIEEEYFDKMGGPAVNRENIHRYAFSRDDKGRNVALAFFGIANQPTKNRVERVCMIKYDYNADNLLQNQSYWKDENTPMENWAGVHKIVFSYNEQGLETEVTNYDKNGKLFVDTSGWSRVVKKYDSNARISECSRFDGNTPVLTVKTKIRNYHSIRLGYDEKNRIIEIQYLDVNEKPTNAQIDLQEGFECSKIELKYVASRLVEERFYTLNSSYPSRTIDCLKYDYVDPHGMIFGRKNRQ
jgi:hypothetical protein